MLASNTVIQNRYRIVRKLGEGGMGSVYLAIDERFDSEVAIKVSRSLDDVAKRQFEREARLLNRLRHPALTRVIDYFTEEDGQFLVMDYVGGEDLWEMLQKRDGAFPLDQVLEWADQLLDALCYLHKQVPPIIHRDIKPQNLKLSDTGQITLLDFGLAKGTLGQSTSIMTSKSFYGFTPVYAPLEQIAGEGTDPRSDLYSLGTTLYHLMTGVIPTDTLTRFNAAEQDKPDPLRPANEVNPQITTEIADVLRKAAAVNRRDRFSSAVEMREALRRAGQSWIARRNEIREAGEPPANTNPAWRNVGQEQEQSPQTPPVISPSYSKKPEVTNPILAAPTIASSDIFSLNPPFQQPSFNPPQIAQFPVQPAAKKSSRLPWIIGVFVALLIVTASILFFINRNSRKSSSSNDGATLAREDNSSTNPNKDAEAAAQLDKEGNDLFKQSKYAKAEAKFSEAVKLDPNNPEWRDDLITPLQIINKPESIKVAKELESLARTKLRSEPNNAKLHTFLSSALRIENKLDESLREVREAIRLDPNYAIAHQYLAITLSEQKKLDEAIAEDRKAIDLDPNRFEFHYDLGTNLYEQQKYEEAEKELKEALRLAPNFALTHAYLTFGASWTTS